MKKELSKTDIINWWLGEFFDTNLADVRKAHPEWKDNSDEDTSKFYKEYAVTKEQMIKFDEYFYKEIPKLLQMTQKLWKRASWLTYIDAAPYEIRKLQD